MKAKVEHVVPLSAKAPLHRGPSRLGSSVFTHTGTRPADNFAEDKERLGQLRRRHRLAPP
jgi:hypothetical protein